MRFDGDSVVVRTPSSCTSWHNDFRIHIVKDYSAPNTLVNAVESKHRNTGKVYAIQGQRVSFEQSYRTLQNMEAKLVVEQTLVVNVGTKKAMELNDPDPAMRILMVYAFLTGEDIPGLSPYTVIDWKP